jgi:hypothetical protein
MRGCLFVMLAGVAVLAAAIWFAGPPLAGAAVGAALTSGGLSADEMTVDVESDPPLQLAIGQADRVTVSADDVNWNGIRAGRLEVELRDVDLIGRTVRTADGRLEEVQLEEIGEDGEPLLMEITFSGPADEAVTAISIDRPTAERLAAAAFEAQIGTPPESVDLVAPDVVRFTSAGQIVSGRLEVTTAGELQAATPLGSVTLLENRGLPMQLTDVSVGQGGIEVTGLLDVSSLLD